MRRHPWPHARINAHPLKSRALCRPVCFKVFLDFDGNHQHDLSCCVESCWWFRVCSGSEESDPPLSEEGGRRCWLESNVNKRTEEDEKACMRQCVCVCMWIPTCVCRWVDESETQLLNVSKSDCSWYFPLKQLKAVRLCLFCWLLLFVVCCFLNQCSCKTEILKVSISQKFPESFYYLKL